jgi:TolB protein
MKIRCVLLSILIFAFAGVLCCALMKNKNTLELEVIPTILPADGESSADVFAMLTDDDRGDAPVEGHSITFKITTGSGSLSANEVTTNASGEASVTYTTGTTGGLVKIVSNDVTNGAKAIHGTTEVQIHLEPNIYFQTDRNGDGFYEIYLMTSDGRNPAEVFTRPVNVEEPAVSPDRTKIAYIKNVSGITQIYIANIDGISEQVMTSSTTNNHDPSWSPDGLSIVFVRDFSSLMTIDMSQNEIHLIDGLTNAGRPTYADANNIVYQASTSGKSRIYKYTLGVGSTDLSKIEADSDLRYDFYSPAASAAAGKIAFVSTMGATSPLHELYVMNMDGTNVKKLTERTGPGNSYDNLRPVWSPDGIQIVFYSNVPGGAANLHDITRIDADGTGLFILSDSNYDDKNPAW